MNRKGLSTQPSGTPVFYTNMAKDVGANPGFLGSFPQSKCKPPEKCLIQPSCSYSADELTGN